MVLFPYTDRPVKRPRLNLRTGMWDLYPGCCCQIRVELHTSGKLLAACLYPMELKIQCSDTELADNATAV